MMPESQERESSRPHSNLPGVLVLHLTFGCTARCRHCTVECCPEKVGACLTREEIVQAVQTAAGHGIKMLELTGGEPFLRQDLMKYALGQADRHGVKVFTATNSFWATDASAARRVLQGLRGLCAIQFSADSYHQEHVPLSRVKTGVRVAADMGFDVQLSVTDSHAGRTVTMAGLGKLVKYASQNPAMAMHNTQPPAQVGRGALLPESDCLFDFGMTAPMECSHFERHNVLVSVFPGRRVSFCCGNANPRFTWHYAADPDWLGRMLEVWSHDAAVSFMWNMGLARCWALFTGRKLSDGNTFLIRKQPCGLCFSMMPHLFPRDGMVDIRASRAASGRMLR